jgi:hypothetical protein
MTEQELIDYEAVHGEPPEEITEARQERKSAALKACYLWTVTYERQVEADAMDGGGLEWQSPESRTVACGDGQQAIDKVVDYRKPTCNAVRIVGLERGPKVDLI